jgi:phosphatidylethanolamine-binding protein (PEBP) family uncharacterized protein
MTPHSTLHLSLRATLIFALTTTPLACNRAKLQAGATKKQLLDAMTGHILAHGQTTGRYQR